MTDTAKNEDAAVALLYEMTTIVREEIGMNELFAAQIAEAITRGLRRRLGGEYHYIPAPDKTERDAAIRAQFNGRNLEEVARCHGVSRRQAYRIVTKR